MKDIPTWTVALEEAKQIILRENGVPVETTKMIGHKDITLMRIESDPIDFQIAARIVGKALELLLISKNHKYGKGNMLSAEKFGMSIEQGLMLRENDKTERILNHLNGVDLGVEGLIESFGDKCGYAAIGMMLQLVSNNHGKSQTWYELPISEESD